MSAVLTSKEKSKEEIISYNPATGAEIGRVAAASAEDVREAVKRAKTAFKDWKTTSFIARAEIMRKAREIILREAEEIAELISKENGKPKLEAYSSEIVPALDLMNYFAKETAKLLKPERINLGLLSWEGRSSKIIYEPLGVIGIISPWNYAFSIPFGEVVMSLMAGNCVVLKPSEITPLIGLKIGEIFTKAGVPTDVLQVLSGDGKTGAALVEAKPDKIIFTGSVATGKKIAASAAQNLTPIVLELGGKDAMIVLEDAHLETAAQAAVWGAFTNSGQACASVERCYVHEKIAQEFTAKVIEITRQLRQNNGLEENTDIGAMTSENQLKIVESHVESFRAEGAKILIGGKRRAELSGFFFEPTIIADAENTMRGMREETFGPTLPIAKFKTDEEAIALANDSDFGLTALIFTADLERGQKIAEKLEAGTVMINEVLYTHGIAQTPWGGVKNSGYGRTHGKRGLLELVSAKHLHINRNFKKPNIWWFGYSPQALELFRVFAREYTTGSLLKVTKLLPRIRARLNELFK